MSDAPGFEGGLGQLLRSRRERLRPADVGLPTGPRRRTPGLRREEVAQLAGLSTTYYTFLEQGRATRPSPEVLDSLVRVLHLDAIEQRALRDLAFAASAAKADEPETLAGQVERLVQRLSPEPTFVKGRRWDVLAANPSATALHNGWAGEPGPRPNMLRWMFSDPAARTIYDDWEHEARSMLARFRAAVSMRSVTAEAEALVTEITDRSAEARRWWRSHDVASVGSGFKVLHHPELGELRLEHAVLHVGGRPEQHLVTFTGAEADETARFERLAALAEPHH